METAISVAIKILFNIAIIMICSMILELMMTGSITTDVATLITGVVNSVLQIPMILMDFLVCIAFQLFDFAIEAIWDIIPGLSDAFSAPSASDLFSAC